MRGSRFYFHVVNRNEVPRKVLQTKPLVLSERRRKFGTILRHGEAWLEFWGLRFHWCWSFFSRSKFFGAELKTCGEESDLSFFMACPPVALWFSVGGLIPRPRMEDDARYMRLKKKAETAKAVDGREMYIHDLGFEMEAFSKWRKHQPGERETGISIHGGMLWFDFWQKTMESSSRTPWYRHFAFDPLDFLLGPQKYSEKPLYEEDVEIPMPEKTYQGHVRIYESSWKRELWPFTKRMIRSSIDVPEGLPHAGKGENSWDCGDDATFALHSCAKTPKEAIAAIIETEMKDREKYGNASSLRSVKT